jgi:peptide-methionine (R)-S-oxide reductase
LALAFLEYVIKESPLRGKIMKHTPLTLFLKSVAAVVVCGALLFLARSGLSRTENSGISNARVQYAAAKKDGKSASFKRPPTNTKAQCDKITDAQWKKMLTPAQYHILREAGTDPPFTGNLLNNHQHGIYRCAGCGQPLFTSEPKFHSGTGWPSFWQPIKGAVVEKADNSLGMSRTEVLCSRCGGHLGHVFNDGPQPTGLRYCMDTNALTFEKK